MQGLKAAAYGLPLASGLAMAALRIDTWAFWEPVARDAAPLFWWAIDWLLYPFSMAGLPLLAPTAWILSLISPLLTHLIGAEGTQNGASFIMVPCLLFSLYLVARGRSIVPDELWRVSGAGSIVLILFGLLSILSVKGSGDGQAAIAMVMGQNGGVVAAMLVAEWLLRRARRRAAR